MKRQAEGHFGPTDRREPALFFGWSQAQAELVGQLRSVAWRGVRSARVAVPRLDPKALANLQGFDLRAVWAGHRIREFCLGKTWFERFAAPPSAADLRTMWAHHRRLGSAQAYAGLPFWSGQSTAHRRRKSEPWGALGHGFVLVPRWIYREVDGSAELVLQAMDAEPPGLDSDLTRIAGATLDPSMRQGSEPGLACVSAAGPRRRAGRPARGEEWSGGDDEWPGGEALWGEVPCTDAPISAAVTAGVSGSARAREDDWLHWQNSVEAAQAAIRRGGLQKVVLTRSRTLRAAQPWRLSALVAELWRSTHATVRWAVATPELTFMSATPERLFALGADGTLETDALAGTVERARAGELQQSAKLIEEHDYVVRGLREALAELCTTVSLGATEVSTAGHLAHRRATLRGRLREGVGAVDVLLALHPTPAVAGYRRAAALEWLGQHEEEDRGLFSGPVVRVAPDGVEAAVALRTALVVGCQARLQAGAGLTLKSCARSEYTETQQKMQTMARLLLAACREQPS